MMMENHTAKGWRSQILWHLILEVNREFENFHGNSTRSMSKVIYLAQKVMYCGAMRCKPESIQEDMNL